MLRSCRLPTRDCRAAPARPALRRLPKEGRHSSPAKPPSSYSSPKPPSSSPPNPPPPFPAPQLLLKHRLQTGSLSLGPFFGPKKLSKCDQYCKIYFAGYIGKRQRDIRAKANTPPTSPNIPNIPTLHAPDNFVELQKRKVFGSASFSGKMREQLKTTLMSPQNGFFVLVHCQM